MCGRIDKAYTIRATADTINFKFRPLSANHPYLQTLANTKYKASDHVGFKIYFQAIPPKAPTDDSYTQDEQDNPAAGGKGHSNNNNNNKKGDQYTSTGVYVSSQSIENDYDEDAEANASADTKFKSESFEAAYLTTSFFGYR